MYCPGNKRGSYQKQRENEKGEGALFLMLETKKGIGYGAKCKCKNQRIQQDGKHKKSPLGFGVSERYSNRKGGRSIIVSAKIVIQAGFGCKMRF